MPPPFCSAHSPTGPRSTLVPGHELHTLVELIRFLFLPWDMVGAGRGRGGKKKIAYFYRQPLPYSSQTGRLLLKYNVPVKLTLQHPPRATPRAFEHLKIGLFKFLPLGQKSRSSAPPIVTEIPLLKDRFRLQSNTVHACQREICRNDTFKLHLKTVLSALFTNKGEILPWKSVKPCKNRKKLTGILR